MALNLTKSKSINLTKSLPQLNEFILGMAWDKDADLDACAFVLDENGKRIDVVYYDNLSSPGVKHSGDAQDGSAAGDDETISILVNELPANAAKVVLGLTCYDKAQQNELTFGAAANPVAKLYDQDGKVLVESPLDSEAAFSSAVSFVEISKGDDGWSFTNLSENHGTHINGLALLDQKYQ